MDEQLPNFPCDETNGDAEPPVKEKKRPGRPKKQVAKKPIPREGIVREPKNKHLESTHPALVNVLEVVYENPTMFKKIFHLFKTMDSDMVRVRFDREEIKMYALDHQGKSKIYVVIYGDRINRYYVAEPFEIGCDAGRINEKLATLTKDHSKIVILTTRQYRHSKITIILTNDDIEEDGIDVIEIDEMPVYDWAIEEELKMEIKYPIRFEMQAKYFKKLISDFSHGCKILRIEKTGYENLHLSYNHDDKNSRHDSLYRNPGKINLISLLDEDDIFSSSVKLENIKPLSSALIADEIQIAADKEEDLIFTAYLDQQEKSTREPTAKKYKVLGTEKCVIKVMVDIVRSDVD